MSSKNYQIKMNNDYDIRFIVEEMNDEIYKKIRKVLCNIKKDLQDMGYGCEISDIIGPARMIPKSEKNILLHAITMTKKDLDELPNIHKYSYSCKYNNLYGEDLIGKYKSIIITPKDVIDSIEGIEYCIELIKQRKVRFTKWINNNNHYVLSLVDRSASYYDMLELFNYAYNKSKNNIINMMDTNNIRCNIEDYLIYNEKESSLINKIDKNDLSNEDIENNINTIISILLKMEKACLQLYKSKKYYNSLEWGIINVGSDGIRNKGFQFIKNIGLPAGNNFNLKFAELENSKEKVMREINDSNYLVLFDPPNNNFKRFAINNVNSYDKIIDFINRNNCDLSQYKVSFVEKINTIPNSFAGTLISDGKGNTIIEIIKNTCDTRELTSTGADSNEIEQYRFISFDDCGIKVPSNIKEIKEICQYFRGYYEFAYGKIRDRKDIYFTFYSSNSEYINIFEGGKKYGKTL